jgi:hypothetical protein
MAITGTSPRIASIPPTPSIPPTTPSTPPVAVVSTPTTPKPSLDVMESNSMAAGRPLFQTLVAKPRLIVSAAAVGCILLSGCAQTPAAQPDEAIGIQLEFRPGLIAEASYSRVTMDIKSGIEDHIREQTSAGDGVYRYGDEDAELELKLVRVHMEYLAQLGPTSHFACVDLATANGDVYDVDFFLEGEPGNMAVSETTLHKRNGQPRYVWEQEEDDSWVRVNVENAAPELLGVIRGQDAFTFAYTASIPEITESARMWIPLAADDKNQKIISTTIQAPGTQDIIFDKEYGNKILFLSLTPADSGKDLVVTYEVERSEVAVYPEPADEAERHLRPERLVPATAEFAGIAADVVKGLESDIERARALFDHTIDNLRYAKIGTKYGQGDAQYACDAGVGNCTDYHSYFIALARSVGIPARFAIGASIPSMRDNGGISGYHCWAEFYADGHWWPVDISEADKSTSLSSFYFGHHPANRIEFSRGRDLIVEPAPMEGPINFLAYPLLEVDGAKVKAKTQFSFRRR